MYPKCALLAFFRKLKMSLNVFYYFLLISLFRTGVWRDSLKWQVQVHLFFFWLFMIESFILLTLSLIEPSARVSENSSLFLCEQGSHFTGSMLLCLIWKKIVYVNVWVFMYVFLCVSVPSHVHMCTFLHVSVNVHVHMCTCLLVRVFPCAHACLWGHSYVHMQVRGEPCVTSTMFRTSSFICYCLASWPTSC